MISPMLFPTPTRRRYSWRCWLYGRHVAHPKPRPLYAAVGRYFHPSGRYSRFAVPITPRPRIGNPKDTPVRRHVFMSRDYSPGYTQRSAFIHQVRIFPRLHVEMTARQCSPAKKSHELNEQMHRCSSLLSVRCERRQVPVATTTRACLCCMHDDDDGDDQCRRQLLDDVQLSGALWGQRNSVDVHTRRCLC